ncbi:DoxX family protein [Edaphobacter aggregans]|uniref:DoxX family protein n=1 Tax=Edaphobacter aggregans TaxID=570835 RepID=UPI00068F279C|nr:hypothetical protein [Edaphobacter aggregans]
MYLVSTDNKDDVVYEKALKRRLSSASQVKDKIKTIVSLRRNTKKKLQRPLVTVTGVVEFLGAIGLMLTKVAPYAALGLAIMLLAVFPANIHAARQRLTIAVGPWNRCFLECSCRSCSWRRQLRFFLLVSEAWRWLTFDGHLDIRSNRIRENSLEYLASAASSHRIAAITGKPSTRWQRKSSRPPTRKPALRIPRFDFLEDLESDAMCFARGMAVLMQIFIQCPVGLPGDTSPQAPVVIQRFCTYP